MEILQVSGISRVIFEAQFCVTAKQVQVLPNWYINLVWIIELESPGKKLTYSNFRQKINH